MVRSRAMFALLFAALPNIGFAAQCYEGTATINQATAGNNCTQMEKGYSNSSAGPLTHAGCTAAKANAREKLVVRIQQSCAPYIQTNAPCQVINLERC